MATQISTREVVLVSPTTAEERVRWEQTRQGFASDRLEGLEPGPDEVQDANDYIQGRITAQEQIERVRLRYGLN